MRACVHACVRVCVWVCSLFIVICLPVRAMTKSLLAVCPGFHIAAQVHAVHAIKANSLQATAQSSALALALLVCKLTLPHPTLSSLKQQVRQAIGARGYRMHMSGFSPTLSASQ